MRYKAIALDVCGVLTTHKSVWQFIHEELGLWEGRAEKYQEEFRAGLISYREFCEKDARLWAGMGTGEMEGIVERLKYTDGIGGFFSALEDRGIVACLISTGLTLLTDRISRDFNVKYSYANHLISSDGVLTGGVDIRVPNDGKGRALVSFCDSLGIEPSNVIAVGDGVSDVPMFCEAGFAIGFGEVSVDVEGASDVIVPEEIEVLIEVIDKIP